MTTNPDGLSDARAVQMLWDINSDGVAAPLLGKLTLRERSSLLRTMLIYAHGMKPWKGDRDAPNDWNGGRVLLASDQLWHPYQSDESPDWQHHVSETGCLEPGCIVAYVAKTERSSNLITAFYAEAETAGEDILGASVLTLEAFERAANQFASLNQEGKS